MAAISKASGRFGLLQGTSAETSGGLLICLPREQAARFCSEIKSSKYGEGHQAWIVGIVEKGNRTARIIDKPGLLRSFLVGPPLQPSLQTIPVPLLNPALEME
ncbi:hypothetical protein QTO34_013242 [Cnephaeus nilssonii]|uniref:Selenide, water dikinase n=1 Tax=Cnephaeus nilssonii TaxID=3371016 RepID=A0AA40I7L5_CNENI|nr:hypothetical protein QTO34_013242 [Eptesicus nilssonii]